MPLVLKSVPHGEGLPVPLSIEHGSDKSESENEKHVEKYRISYDMLLNLEWFGPCSTPTKQSICSRCKDFHDNEKIKVFPHRFE
ncbi:hypothetical protein NPIL_53391 [Nephila pilipes]|uniref:Uncharacterized protein n=1 Tax=Nephila pilipes TaxID=299642 RepID=A0A8X6TLT9_NEPPI|nr:hypothetical protein NPIL_53391 [Nephila pilipes]